MVFLLSLTTMAAALLTLWAVALIAVHYGRPRGRPQLDSWVLRRFIAYRKSSSGEPGAEAVGSEHADGDLARSPSREPELANPGRRAVRSTGRAKLVPA